MLIGGLAQAGPLQGHAAQFEQLEADPVAAAVPLQPAHGAQLVGQPVHGRLGQADPVTDLAHAEGMVAAVEGREDGLEPAHDRARLAVLLSVCVCFPGRADVAALDGGQANAVLKRSHYLVTSGLH